ncbi:DiGeorge syndrome critical region protein 14 [Gryganskiella cystojenkinii]|nr:DiGeorge syndrome critical region protein 14 [Gryganskiella cystojenkinii]
MGSQELIKKPAEALAKGLTSTDIVVAKPGLASTDTTIQPATTSSVLVSHTRNGKPLYQSNVPTPLPQTVLEEDDYTEALSKIIERDFYPDLAKLKRQHAYLDAVQMNDLERIAATARDLAGNDTPLAQRRLKTPVDTPKINRRSGLPDASWTPARVDTEAGANPTWRDEVDADGLQTPVNLDTPSHVSKKARRGGGEKAANEQPEKEVIDTNLSLDQFQAKYTSEDNASFLEIMDKVNTRKKDEYHWMYDQEKKSMHLIEYQRQGIEYKDPNSSSEVEEKSKLQLMLADKRSGTVATWGYKAKNALMYLPEGLGSDLNDRAIRGNPKEIAHANTAFQGHDLLVVNQAAAAKFDPAPFLKAGVVTDSPKVNGFGFVSSTPTPCMSELGDDPEMLTWGTIEDEPLLISSGISAGASAPSPFRIPETPRRELIAQKLAERASKSFSLGSSKRTQVFSSPKYNAALGGATPTPKFNSPHSVISSQHSSKYSSQISSPRSRAAMLSPAAKRLLEQQRKKTSGDRQLRSSYTSTPRQTSSSTPLRNQTTTPSPLTRKV